MPFVPTFFIPCTIPPHLFYVFLCCQSNVMANVTCTLHLPQRRKNPHFPGKKVVVLFIIHFSFFLCACRKKQAAADSYVSHATTRTTTTVSQTPFHIFYTFSSKSQERMEKTTGEEPEEECMYESKKKSTKSHGRNEKSNNFGAKARKLVLHVKYINMYKGGEGWGYSIRKMCCSS